MRANRKAPFLTIILLSVILHPFLAIVPNLKANPDGMEQVLFGGYHDLTHTAIVEHNSIIGGDTWWNIENYRHEIVSTDGKLKHLRVKLTGPPGAGNWVDFTLYVNGYRTDLTLEIADAATTGANMEDEVPVTAGDRISLECHPWSFPTEAYATWSLVFEGDNAKESLILGGSGDNLNNAATEYAQVMCAYCAYTNIEDSFRQVVPTSGTIKNLYVYMTEDAGVDPDAYRFTVRLNGATVAQSPIVTITAPATTGNDVAHNLVVVAGDILTLMIEPLNGPASTPRAAWGLTFVADIDGESIILGGTLNSLHVTNTEYNYLQSSGGIWTVNENERYQLGQICILKKLNILLTDTPGAGNSFEFTVRVAGADSGLVCKISNLETTGHSSVSAKADIANDDYVDLEVVPISTPFSGVDAYWGLVCYTGTVESKYTPKIATFAIAADGVWTDYDLFTNLGVPKGAIAEIVCANKNEDFARVAGVRTDGSALNRYIDLHEAEGLGVTTANMFVKCDETTGLIECFSEIGADVDFYLLGYFSLDVDFTEAFTSLGNPGLAWADLDLTASGVPDDAVVQILMGNEASAADFFAGIRENGSTLERGYTLDEAEGGSKRSPSGSWTTLSMVVQPDAGAVIEWKAGSATYVTMWLLGWFSSNINFTEGFTDYSPAADNTWTEKTIAEAAINSVVAFALVHQDSGAETFCGLREEGSVLARMIEEHEAEGGSSTGFQACILLDADKKCEVYCEDASEAQFSYTGYFIITLPPVKPNIPSLVAIIFNTTIAETGCGIYAAFFDTEGLYGYIFWNNATSAPGGVNSSFTSMTGTSNSTQEDVTLPSSGTLFGCKYYVNDTDGYWGRDSLIMFPTAAIGDGAVNIPAINEIVFNTTIAETLCEIYGDFSDVEGLSGYIFWNNATSPPGGVNSSFTVLTGTSNSTYEDVILPVSGTRFGVKYYVNDTDGNWGVDTLAMFPSIEIEADVTNVIMGASGVFWIILIIIVPIVAYVLKKG